MKPLVILMLISAGYVSSVFAAPYQFEAGVLLAQADSSSPGGVSRDIDTQAISLAYYLMPVSANTGPLSQRAFISKSASIAGTYNFIKPERSSDIDLLQIDTRFVTQTDMIFEFDYEKTDYDSNTDSTADYSVGIGKYLDSRTTVVFTYEHVDFGDDNGQNLRGTYQRLLQGSAPGTHISYDFALAYIKVPNDSGFGIDAKGTYYFSNEFSAYGGLGYVDVGDADTTSISAGVEYFFSETLFGALSYLKNDFSSNADVSLIGGRVGLRF